MTKLTVKFGGTSLGSIEKILNAAKIVKKRLEEGNQIIVVVSAMAGTTDDLLKKSKSISNNFDRGELDVLFASGEQVTSSLLSGALISLGINSRSWMGWQIPIVTEGEKGLAKIAYIKTDEISKFISEGGVAVVPGFQGISKHSPSGPFPMMNFIFRREIPGFPAQTVASSCCGNRSIAYALNFTPRSR